MAAATRGGGKVSLGGFVTMSENANAGGRNSGIRQNCSSEGNTKTNPVRKRRSNALVPAATWASNVEREDDSGGFALTSVRSGRIGMAFPDKGRLVPSRPQARFI